MEMSQLDSDLRLPPRKRLLAGYMKLNGSSSSSSSTSPSSTSNSINSSSSSSASTSRFQNQSPEEVVEAARSAAALAVKAAKAARAIANEKALISSKAIAAAKRALELVDSFPKQTMADNLSSKGELRHQEEDLTCRLQRAIDRKYPKVLATREANSRINKKQKVNKTLVEGGSRVTGYKNDNDEVVDSDSSYDGLGSHKKARKSFKPEEVDSIPTPGKEKGEEQRRGRVKIKKFPLSICKNSRDQENGISCESQVPVAQTREDGVVQVIPGPSSQKCQELKASECLKQNKPVRS